MKYIILMLSLSFLSQSSFALSWCKIYGTDESKRYDTVTYTVDVQKYLKRKTHRWCKRKAKDNYPVFCKNSKAKHIVVKWERNNREKGKASYPCP